MCLGGVVVRRYIDILILLIPTTLVCALFCSSIPTFGSLKKKFFVLVRRMPNCGVFYFARCVRKLSYYSDVIHSFDWKSAVEHDSGVYETSRSSLLIQSTVSMMQQK